ncbi:MAG: hypothetical protein ACW96U_06070, partial [Candidatus Heimdallarchaeaceae archaeon]
MKAKDDFDNERILYYQIGYDESSTNIILTNQVNGSVIGDSSSLEFSAYNISYALCEWDTNGTVFNLTETNYITYAPYSLGYHNLTVETYDEFETVKFFYYFEIDNAPPVILLYGVSNDSSLPAGKAIDVNITDQSPSLEIFYKWDNREFISWSPFTGTIYRTYLPETEGGHWLNISTTDNFGHQNNISFYFTANIDILLVELVDMVNNSFYYGGNDVNITISNSNTTVYYKWNGGIEKSIVITDPFLYLTGVDALPLILGVHFLTIRTFDIFDIEWVFVFNFTLDQESPVIDSSINNYNNSRYLPSTIFTFIFSDNYTLNSDLNIIYSINGGLNKTLSIPFELSLSFFSDGDYILILYVFDIANNFATATIVFSIDTISPELEILIEGLAIVLLDGSKYIPANATITVYVDDADPNTLTTYSWGGSIYYIFTDNFTLNYPDGTATLYINATDSVGHQDIETFVLTIDSIAPTLEFPSNYSVINKDANLIFVVDDISIETIKEVRYAWDIFVPFSISLLPDASGEVTIKLYFLYTERVEPAILFFNVTDIVGNTQSYQFSFEIDLTPPLAALYLFDSEIGEYYNFSSVDFLNYYSSIWYNSSENRDLREFIYYWDGEVNNATELSEPWELHNMPTIDGFHNLTIILKDNTTDGDFPNVLIETYYFTIDNIKIDYISPVDFQNDYYHQMEYKDNLVVTLNISDALDNSSIENLGYSVIKDTVLNLGVSITELTNYTYEITISATNVTDGEYTEIELQFWQFEENKEIIRIYLLIDKKEGNLLILESSSNVIYGEDIFIKCRLLDDLNISAQEIVNVEIDEHEITNFWIVDSENMIFQINISSSSYFTSKGNYSLQIYASSHFFFDFLTSEKMIDIEIQPIPVILFGNVSSLEVVEGTQLAIYGQLTYINGEPIELETLFFYVYIFYKNESKGVQAQIAGYDDLQILSGITNSTGLITVVFEMTSDIDYIEMRIVYEGSSTLSNINFRFSSIVYSVPPPGIPLPLLIAIIVGAV